MNTLPKHNLFEFYDGFDHFFPNQLLVTKREPNTPRVDIIEVNNQYMVKADLPGVKKEDIILSCDNGHLIIKTELNQEIKEEYEGKILRQERQQGQYMRNLYLGDNIDQNTIDATFSDGVLTLTVPKKQAEEHKTQQIEIH